MATTKKTTKKADKSEAPVAPAITLNNISAKHGSRFERRRLGIGEGSGLGQTASRGQKGQRSRSGDGKMPGFEGGQTPLLRRVPKRGFTNGPFKKIYQVVSLESIERVFKNQKDVTIDALKLHGLISGRAPVKVLGDGELSRAYKITAHAFSASALEKIKKAGGAAEALEKKEAETKA